MINKEQLDTYRHKGMRKKLVEAVAKRGITNKDVLRAIDEVPRHLYFFDSVFLKRAYDDNAFPIGEGQTISQPYTVAYQSSLLEIKKGDKVLEVGTGSGYQASVLAQLGAKVFSIERQKKLFDKTKILLSDLGYSSSVKCFYGDGFAGLPLYAPFDKIIVTAAAPFVPDSLLGQMKIGAMLVIPVGENIQTMKRIIRVNETEWKEELFDNFRFVPMLEGKSN
ncbi:MAG TPA: protein-L-isoaspartate O-methyltransferase [Bacteroidetes bacterium]|nr:protein-L-isoaspartate O-methyltransferase [Bacteroidota bacterium]